MRRRNSARDKRKHHDQIILLQSQRRIGLHLHRRDSLGSCSAPLGSDVFVVSEALDVLAMSSVTCDGMRIYSQPVVRFIKEELTE